MPNDSYVTVDPQQNSITKPTQNEGNTDHFLSVEDFK